MLQVRRLEKISEGRSVLTIDAFDVAAGEVVAVIGPGGSGKTLLVRLLSGTVPASGGSIVFDPACPAPQPVGVLFEEDLLYERMSALENLKFYAQLQGFPAAGAGEALDRVGLSDQANKPASKLTPSAQRRLAFARLLLGRHCFLLLDQPIRRTDLDTQQLFARLIRQAAAAGAAVLLTDEDLSWAGKCCTRVVELEDGRVASAYALENTGDRTAPAPEQFMPFKVSARKEDRILLYDPGDILYATSRDGKTYLRTAAEEAVANLTLQELESRLVGRGFFKAHRAYLVNLQHVKAVIQYTRNSYSLQLDDAPQTLIPLSKQFEKELRDLLGY
jgi:ABC-2 type transport system ATP-binding protein